MLNQMQSLIDYHPLYEQIKTTVDNYHDNFEQTFNFKECALICQLEEKATRLKSEISELKKLTSPETIQTLIMKKKQQKESERAKLQLHWRQITERLKKLQEEEKKLINENSQSQFDIANLQKKIQQLVYENYKLENKVENIRSSRKNKTFITESEKKSYISPYRITTNFQNKCGISQNKTKQQDLDEKLTYVKAIQKIPNNVLMQFLNRKDIKSKIYQILR